MRRPCIVWLAAVAALASAGFNRLNAASPEQGSQIIPSAAPAHRALVDQYCVSCHNQRNKSAVRDFVLDSVDVTKVTEHPEIWEKVLRKLRAGLMPPAGARRPE